MPTIIDTTQPNPKQIFIDWAKGIRESAYRGKQSLKVKVPKDKDIDDASDCFGEIIGQCDAILAVLKNAR